MRVIRKHDILANQGWITSNNITTDATTKWDGTAVSAGDQRKVIDSTGSPNEITYMIYESITGTGGTDPTVDVKSGDTPGIGTDWKEVGTVNDLAWASDVAQDQAVNATTIELSIDPDLRINAAGFFNLDAAELDFVSTSVTYGEVYNQNHDLVQPRGLGSYWDYCYEPVVRMKNYGIFDIPAYSDAAVDITLTVPSGNASVGAIILGQSLDVGKTLYSSSFGFTDYSKANYVPELNRIVRTERDYTENGSWLVLIERGKFQYMKQELLKLRNTVSAWSADSSDHGALIMGFLDDIEIVVSGTTHILARVKIQGVT